MIWQQVSIFLMTVPALTALPAGGMRFADCNGLFYVRLIANIGLTGLSAAFGMLNGIWRV
jgi:hypothetical protein